MYWLCGVRYIPLIRSALPEKSWAIHYLHKVAMFLKEEFLISNVVKVSWNPCCSQNVASNIIENKLPLFARIDVSAPYV